MIPKKSAEFLPRSLFFTILIRSSKSINKMWLLRFHPRTPINSRLLLRPLNTAVTIKSKLYYNNDLFFKCPSSNSILEIYHQHTVFEQKKAHDHEQKWKQNILDDTTYYAFKIPDAYSYWNLITSYFYYNTCKKRSTHTNASSYHIRTSIKS